MNVFIGFLGLFFCLLFGSMYAYIIGGAIKIKGNCKVLRGPPIIGGGAIKVN